MTLHYINDSHRMVEYVVDDWEAALGVASVIVHASIDIEYLHYENDTGQGVFNLNTFERC